MKFSIIIPTYNNCDYLKLCIDSIRKNSSYDHQIIVHINGNDQETQNYINQINIDHTKTNENVGLCKGVNTASEKVNTNYVVYAHDDMYFLPDWDYYLEKEFKLINHNLFYLSLTQISYRGAVKGNIQHIQFDCGDTIKNFNEKKLLDNYQKIPFNNLQGSHWAPHIIHKELWDKIGGFSEEFDPGFASDPDLNMKLWKEGVRIFKSVSKSRVYHFGSLTTRKNIKIIRNNGKKTFLIKWGITIELFVKYYLRRGTVYKYPLEEPKKDMFYYFNLIGSKIKFLIVKILNEK